MSANAKSAARKLRFKLQRVPMLVTIVLFVLMFGGGTYAYDFSAQVFLNLFIDNAFLMVVAVGMTFVILSGGIDLSVGSVIALTTMISAVLLEHHHWSPFAVIPLVLVLGAAFGALMGAVIHYFRLQAFIVTLAGMFLARGLCYLLSIDTITITDPLYTAISQNRIELWGELFISWNVIIALAVIALAVFVAHYTSFGRNVYAMGGNERSALLMGLPVARTRVLVASSPLELGSGVALTGLAIPLNLVLCSVLAEAAVDRAVLTQAFVWLNSASAAGSAGAAAVAGWAVGSFGAHGGFAVAAVATGVMAMLAVTGLRALR